MNIGLDYDGTFTSDPDLWIRFVRDCVYRGHSVYVVTMRYPSEVDGTFGSVDPRLRELLIPVLCTSRLAKAPHCYKLGINIHVWIDDHPDAVWKDGSQIWIEPTAEGDVIDPRYPRTAA